MPEKMQGADLSRVALGKTRKGPDAVLLQIFVPYNPDQIHTPWRGIVTDRYTYARYEHEPWVLFDDKRDPDQLDNLAFRGEATGLRRKLDAKLEQLMNRHGD